MAVELEHAIGFAGFVPGAVHALPPGLGGVAGVASGGDGGDGGARFVSVAGALAFVNSMTDPHAQKALRGHRANISAVACSASGRLLATGDRGGHHSGGTGGSGSLTASSSSSSSSSAAPSGEDAPALGGSSADCDIVVWDLQAGTVLHRVQEHDHGVRALAFSPDERLLLSVADEADGTFLIIDLATGHLVARVRQDPLPATCAAWGGFARDVKGRETCLYLFATGGSKYLTLWTLDPTTGECARDKVALPIATQRDVARDYSALAFSPGPERSWLYAGTTTGEVVIVHTRSLAFAHQCYVVGGGVCSLMTVPISGTPSGDVSRRGIGTHAARLGAINGGLGYGGLGGDATFAEPAPPAGVDLVVGGGDGSVAVWHHAIGIIEGDLTLSAAVSAQQTYGAGRPSLHSRAFFCTRTVRIEGAVWSVSLLAPPEPARGDRQQAGGPSYGFLCGTSAGGLWRVYTVDGSSLVGTGAVASGGAGVGAGGGAISFHGRSLKERGTPAGGQASSALLAAMGATAAGDMLAVTHGLSASLLRQAHACGSDALDPSAAPVIAMAANPGVPQLPAPLHVSTVQAGSIFDVSFSASASDRFATAGADNTVRVWDLADYQCVSSAHVRSVGHPLCVVYANEFHLSGWQDGTLRAYFSDPAATEAVVSSDARQTSMAASAAAQQRRVGGAAALVADTTSSFVGGGSVVSSMRRPAPAQPYEAPPTSSSLAAGGNGYSGAKTRDGSSGGHEARGFLWAVPEAHASKSGGVTALALAHNQRFCVTGGGDARVRVWDMRSREMVSAFVEHGAAVTGLAIYRDDAHVLSCSRDKSFMCWDLRKECRVSQHVQRSGGLNAIAVTRDQSLVLTCGQERKLQLWDLREASPVLSIAPVHGIEGEALTIGVAHASDNICTGGTDGAVKVWDLRHTAHPLADLIGHSGDVTKVAWAPDDKQIASVGRDGIIYVWNCFL